MTRYVVHLPVVAADLAGAIRLARVAAWSVRFLPQADPRATTVSTEANPDVRHRTFCDAALPNGRPCLLRADHDGPCSRRIHRLPAEPGR
ncbi:hypothetical protein GCM10022225_67590 [Plantactinospora mayteni]|uniref:Uncharacterized protein n=1 Tax=Plantactinospora mayteni TaxID=566021 RepID=A0ABQ4EV89_9ACTN|nr:hypothetical protein [Plantactinospora mayteni]GIG98558.1 hypothetical protein Pma05_51310 [Plantactinospora mayteni]